MYICNALLWRIILETCIPVMPTCKEALLCVGVVADYSTRQTAGPAFYPDVAQSKTNGNQPSYTYLIPCHTTNKLPYMWLHPMKKMVAACGDIPAKLKQTEADNVAKRKRKNSSATGVWRKTKRLTHTWQRQQQNTMWRGALAMYVYQQQLLPTLYYQGKLMKC